MTDQGQRGPARPGIDFACFELAGETWAVPIANVREILASPRITPLPDAPSVIEGVVDLRGTLIPIVDLESLLRGEREAKATPAAARPRTVVVEARGASAEGDGELAAAAPGSPGGPSLDDGDGGSSARSVAAFAAALAAVGGAAVLVRRRRNAAS